MKREYFGCKHTFYAYLLTSLQCSIIMLAMMIKKQKKVREAQKTTPEEQEIGLLRELLPKIGGENRAYIKGEINALLYAQEDTQKMTASAAQKGGLP